MRIQMKKNECKRSEIVKKSIVFLITILLMFQVTNYTSHSIVIPETMRIGLFFTDSVYGLDRSVSDLEISSDNGLSIGFSFQNNFFELLDLENIKNIMARRDTYYNLTGQGLIEVEQDKGILGPYKVKIGGEYDDIDAVMLKIFQYSQNGIEAYPAYNDGWQIWTGNYLTMSEALEDTLNIISPALPEEDFDIIHPSDKRIMISDVQGQTILAFESTITPLRIKSKNGTSPRVLRINNDKNKRYRGELEIVRLEESDLTVINVLPLNEYLYGVVPGEIQASSHPEALKAQAVAARTYAISTFNKYSHMGFNMCDTTICQVYRGYSIEQPSTNKAVDDTLGEIVTYNGKVAQVFYFSSSGGMTEDVKNVWGSNIPYLVSVEDNFEAGNSWNYNWDASYSAERIEEIMNSRGFNLGRILNMEVTKRSEAGRAIELVITGTNGSRTYTNSGTRNVFSLSSQWYDIETDADITIRKNNQENINTQLVGKQVMTATGLKTLSADTQEVTILSANNQQKQVPLTPTQYNISGKGWGHGVGMSQEGAKGMALVGFDYKQILEHYFTGAKVQ